MQTILLDVGTWDFITDLDGNIPIASDPYSEAQDAASAIRTFQSEVYYDTTIGVPYWVSVLGHFPPRSLLKSYFVTAALTVPNTVSAVCFITGWTLRKVTGQVIIKDKAGNVSAAGF